MVLFHSHETQSEEVFPGEDVNPRVMVYFLMKVHAIERLWFYLSIGPPDIPISCSFFPLNHPPEFLGDLLDDRVLCVRNVDDYFFGFELFAKFGHWDEFRRVIGVNLNRSIGIILIAILAFPFISLLHYFIAL